MTQDIPPLRRQLLQLKELHDSGVLQAAAYEEGKTAIERQIVDQVMSGASDSPATPAPVPGGAPPQPASQGGPRRSRTLLVSLGAGVLVLAVAGYWTMGSPDQIGSGPSGEPVAGAGNGGQVAPHSTSQEQIAGMAEKLAQRMKDTPDDAEGWAMLARSYTVLGRHPEALVAYEKAVKLRQDDAPLLADYADSLAVRNGRKLAGEPMKWVEAALKLDPRNPKALALAGTDAFDRKDYASAVRYWDQVVQFGAPDSSYVQQVRAGLEEARQLGGLPAATGAGGGNDGTPAAASMVLPGTSVSGKVTLSPDLASLASPDDTVFIYARAADGGQRMPLAIVRLQVKDLPANFTLDDSSSMSPAARISGVKKVVVSARVSKSGQAMPAPGDLTGQSSPVDVGATGMVIDIRERVQ
jgi:cytochrome c-type biogenesis protein CcmH